MLKEQLITSKFPALLKAVEAPFKMQTQELGHGGQWLHQFIPNITRTWKRQYFIVSVSLGADFSFLCDRSAKGEGRLRYFSKACVYWTLTLVIRLILVPYSSSKGSRLTREQRYVKWTFPYKYDASN